MLGWLRVWGVSWLFDTGHIHCVRTTHVTYNISISGVLHVHDKFDLSPDIPRVIDKSLTVLRFFLPDHMKVDRKIYKITIAYRQLF